MARTRIGSAIRAVGFDHQSASISGVNAGRIIMLTAFLAAAIAGLAGILLRDATTSNISRGMGDALLFKGFAAVVVRAGSVDVTGDAGWWVAHRGQRR